MNIIDFDRIIINKLNDGDFFAFENGTFYCKKEFEEWFLNTLKEVELDKGEVEEKINYDFTFVQIDNNKFGLCIFFLNEENERISNSNRIGVIEGYDSVPLSLISVYPSLSLEFFYTVNSWDEEFILIKSFLETYGFINKNVALPKTSVVSERHNIEILNNVNNANKPLLHLNVIDDTFSESLVFDKTEEFNPPELYYKRNKTKEILKYVAIGVGIVLCGVVLFFLR